MFLFGLMYTHTLEIMNKFIVQTHKQKEHIHTHRKQNSKEVNFFFLTDNVFASLFLSRNSDEFVKLNEVIQILLEQRTFPPNE